MSHPGSHGADGRPLPRLIAWEVTRSCMLACKHCRAAAQTTPYEGELSTEECYSLLDNIASFARPIIILTGGEPMLRPDIYDVAAYAHGLDLPVVMAPCGVLIDDDTAAKIVKSGIRRISISLDGATAESHDAFRAVPGAFEASVRGIEAARRAGLDFQINTTVTRHNLAELEAIRDLAVSLGARVFNPFLLVPTGRGAALADQEITPEEYENTLRWLAGRQQHSDIMIRVTCAPHYQRILREEGYKPGPHGGAGCMGGKSFAFISHRGKVQICGFLDVECGDVCSTGFDFKTIWETSEVFRNVRDTNSYHGRCGYCEYRKVCGGCRARAYALSGDYLNEEPFCVYQPRRTPAKDNGAAKLDDVDKRILSVIQTGLPVAEEPFHALSRQLGLAPDDVISRTARLCTDGPIRRLGPVFDSHSLGYSSTLVAARVPEDRLREVAELVSRLDGVTHNYRRRHRYNLWFTLTAPTSEAIDTILESLRRQTGIDDFYSLPALAVYKIKVDFQLVPKQQSQPVADKSSKPASKLSDDEKKLVRLLQDGLPVIAQPFDEPARVLGCTQQRVVEQIAQWLDAGVIRRFGAVVNHRQLGFVANGMCVFNVSPDCIDAIGERLAGYAEVSHCYHRSSAPGWNYNLFAMIHGQSKEEVLALAARISGELELTDYEVLFSSDEYKKVSMRYFVETT
ncbi:MAG: radical SAM protein [Planctomycetes bacterium]|nr:radical SAM protein [Planctomycetota bacterium]